MRGELTNCVDCHMPLTAKTGAGSYGLLLGTPSGDDSDEEIVYWKGDISSHLFDVPFKSNPGVSGVIPGRAMPVPYTKNCAQTCHDAAGLRYQ